MSYKFSANTSGEVTLNKNGSTRNYGKQPIIHFPIVMWYANTQFKEGNLFDNIFLPNAISNSKDLAPINKKSLDELLDSVIRNSCDLPKEIYGDNSVNTDLIHWNLANFNSSGINYCMLISTNYLKINKNGNPDLTIHKEDLIDFASSYFQMIADYETMWLFREKTKHVYKRLKNEGD